jgi:SAM-dependent methyltransferase
VPSTQDPQYAARLTSLERAWWKKVVPDPYQWFLRRLHLGFTLDVGCGIGRGLRYLDGNAVGIDHSPAAVQACRQQGFVAYTPDEFERSDHARPGRFDALLASHVLEHLTATEADDLLRTYLPFVRDGGGVVLIAPQERGYRSDATHVRFVDTSALRALAADFGLHGRVRSFPLPRLAGRAFTYNEFVLVAAKGTPA